MRFRPWYYSRWRTLSPWPSTTTRIAPPALEVEPPTEVPVPLPVAAYDPPPPQSGLLEAAAFPALFWLLRQTGHLGRNLAVLAVKAAAVIGYLTVVPGSALWRGVLGLVDHQFAEGGRRARSHSLETALAHALGRTVYGFLYCVAFFILIMMVAWTIMSDSPGWSGSWYPSGATSPWPRS